MSKILAYNPVGGDDEAHGEKAMHCKIHMRPRPVQAHVSSYNICLDWSRTHALGSHNFDIHDCV